MSHQEPPSTSREFLADMVTLDDELEHDVEECGLCFHVSLMRQVAEEMKDDPRATNLAWALEVKRRWREGKFYRLWQEERAAGREPEAAFAQRGWEP